MADRHRDPNVTVRPTEEEKATAADLLRTEGWTIQAFLLACLRGFLANPKKWLKAAEPYRPPEKPMGRPRKRDTMQNAIIWTGDNFDEIKAMRPDARLGDDGTLYLDYADGSGPVPVGINYLVQRREQGA